MYNRQGDPHAEIPLEGAGRCIQLDWDSDGEKLAILQHNSPVVRLWDANTGTESSVDTNQKDLSFVKWASNAPLLAIGTQKGTLVLFDKRTLKKQSLLGKHTKRITSGAWSDSNELALTSEDKQLTISDVAGLTLLQHSMKAEPSDVHYSDGLVSVISGGKSISIFDVRGSEQLNLLTEITFPSSHGPIVSHEWFGHEYVCVGFESGRSSCGIEPSDRQPNGSEITADACARDIAGRFCRTRRKIGAGHRGDV